MVRAGQYLFCSKHISGSACTYADATFGQHRREQRIISTQCVHMSSNKTPGCPILVIQAAAFSCFANKELCKHAPIKQATKRTTPVPNTARPLQSRRERGCKRQPVLHVGTRHTLSLMGRMLTSARRRIPPDKTGGRSAKALGNTNAACMQDAAAARGGKVQKQQRASAIKEKPQPWRAS